jgi:hypothetical protein
LVLGKNVHCFIVSLGVQVLIFVIILSKHIVILRIIVVLYKYVHLAIIAIICLLWNSSKSMFICKGSLIVVLSLFVALNLVVA